MPVVTISLFVEILTYPWTIAKSIVNIKNASIWRDTYYGNHLKKERL